MRGMNAFPPGPARFGPGNLPRQGGEPGRGPNSGGSDDFARRLDKIISELEQLKRDMNGPRRR
jgi:hypothetical protein